MNMRTFIEAVEINAIYGATPMAIFLRNRGYEIEWALAILRGDSNFGIERP